MLIGAYGADAERVLRPVAAGSGMTLISEPDFSFAAPAHALSEGRTDTHRVWLTGRASPADRWAHPQRPPGNAAQSIADGLHQVGPVQLGEVHGAYVLLVLDTVAQVLTVAHDQLGARSLAYTNRSGTTFFAEHISDLLTLLKASTSPDRLALVQWIDSGTLPLSRSLFSGISRLSPGQALELRGTSLSVKTIWRPIFREPVRLSPPEASTAVAEAAFAAVERAAAGLQKPAVKLSGGLDSACVAAGLSRHAPAPPLALAATFAQFPAIDESDLIRQTAAFTGLELTTVPYQPTQLAPVIRGYIQRWKLPPGSLNVSVWPALMMAARELGVDGLIDGEGGDELFGVWPYLIADRLRQGRLASAWQLTGRLPGVGAEAALSVRLRALRIFGFGGVAPHWSRQVRRHLRDHRQGFGPLVRDTDLPGLVAQDEAWAWKDIDGPLWWRSAVDGLVNWPERVDAGGFLARDAADSGVGRHHPFFHDVPLVETMLATDPEAQFDPVRNRPLLRDGLAGRIPEAVRNRQGKSYLNALTTQPLSGAEGSAMLQRVTSSDAPVREYVSEEGLASLTEIQTVADSRRNWLAAQLFRVASANAWLCELEMPSAGDRSQGIRP